MNAPQSQQHLAAEQPNAPCKHLPLSTAGVLAALWGVGGFFLLLSYALYRLTPMAVEAFDYPLSTIQWLLLAGNLVFMAYSEGYRGFQCNYSPRLAARARYLLLSGSPRERLLAPLFCMNFFAAPRHRIIISYCLLVMIVILVTLFTLLPQPWRGILDAGVVLGLGWGISATVWYCYQAAIDCSYAVDPEIPHLSSAAHSDY